MFEIYWSNSMCTNHNFEKYGNIKGYQAVEVTFSNLFTWLNNSVYIVGNAKYMPFK